MATIVFGPDSGLTAETVVTIGAGTELTIDPAIGSVYAVTVSQNCTLNIATPPTPTAAVTVKLTQSGDSNTVSWGTSIGWDGGVAPTLQEVDGGVDILTFLYFPDVVGWFGFASGLDMSSPSATFPTLGFEAWASPGSDTNLSTDDQYSFAQASALGDQRLGVVWVVTTNATGNDPAADSLDGGGASSWSLEESRTFNTASTVGRRLSMFVARDQVTGSPTDLTVSWSSESKTGCVLMGLRTTGAVPVSALTLASSKGVQNGGITSAVSTTFGAASDASNRQVWAVAINNTVETLTPEANWDSISDRTMLNPSIHLFLLAKDDSFDTSATATLSNNSIWAAAGTEVEQG